MQNSRLPYRPDIDGLRAIAVLSVLFFHLRVPGFDGGFVGVDVFFVISGYLITHIIASELDGGSFSLARFYGRRIRRIVPALFAMLAAVSVAGFFLLIPYFYLRVTDSIAAAALSTSNVYFYLHSGYFDFGSELLPLLHTWSLGVEEQFYLAFPLLFIVGRKALGLRWATIIATLFVISLLAGIIQTQIDQRGAFFLPFSRSWEFLFGSAIAAGMAPRMNAWCGALGLTMIGVGVSQFYPTMSFPGFPALLPCVGAALVISAKPLAVMQSRPLVWIGLISYSLYLWHWPILSFSLLIWGAEINIPSYIALVSAMFALAYLSWRYVELPVRTDRKIFSTRLLVGAFGIGCVLFAGMSVVVGVRSGMGGRFSHDAISLAEGAWDTNPRSTECEGRKPDQIRKGDVCRIGPSNVLPTFAMIGDSFANAMTPGVSYAAEQAGTAGYVMTLGGCYPLVGVRSIGADADCAAFMDAALDLVKATPSIKTIILVSRWSVAVDGSRFGTIRMKNLFIVDAESKERSYRENMTVFRRGVERTAEALTGYKTAVMAYFPEQRAFVPEAAAIRAQFGIVYSGVDRATVDERQRAVREIFDSGKLGFYVIDATKQMCSSTVCPAVVGNRSLYADDNHLSGFGSIRMAPQIVRFLRQ